MIKPAVSNVIKGIVEAVVLLQYFSLLSYHFAMFEL